MSVIMPAHNAEKYISDAISSVIAQSVTDWELLVIDDRSTDGTTAIARGFSNADSRIRVYSNDENIGVAATRNRGISLARGEWIAFLDSDDLWRPQKLARQLEKAASTGAELIYTSYSIFRDDPKNGSAYIVPATADHESLLRENVIGCSTVLVRAAEGMKFSTGIYHEDYAMWLTLLRNGCRAVGCTDVLADWRVSENARSFNKRRAAKMRWTIYRKVEKLPFFKAVRVFAAYTLNGIRKHKRI